MNFNEEKEQLYAIQSKLSAFEHAVSLIYYDAVTTAPKGTAANRAHSMSVLSEEMYRLSTSDETVNLLENMDAELQNSIDDSDETLRLKRMVYLMLKDIRQMKKIPMDEYIAYQELLVHADDIWHKAKEGNDFELFRPVLEQIFETNIRFAGYCAPGKDPYDYWLNEYETGLSKAVLDDFFNTLKARLVPLIKAISSAPQTDDSCIHGDFEDSVQEELAYYLMKTMGLDLEHVGLSTTEHPFTTSLGSHLDERITTKFIKNNFASSMFSVLHEGGHALYDTGSDDSLAYTVLDCGVSMGIHESQSRFYENILGRSREFISFVFPKLKELFPEPLKDADPGQLYKAINKVQPSLIRTEADEVTYCLHVMIRYELEKMIMSGELLVKDLPSEWNRMYKEYLGIDVPDDKHGVLQDSHWSGGMIGYFPSYALGNAYGAQFLAEMKKTVDVPRCLSEGNFVPINEWNRSHIWQYGSLYTPAQLLDNTLGGKFDPNIYADYLEKKYSDIYSL